MKNPFFLFFLLSFSFALSVDTIQGIPDNLVPGSIYTAQFQFTSGISGQYEILVNVSGVDFNETFVNTSGNCTELQAGKHTCINQMAQGTNKANLSFQYTPNIAPGSYPIAVYFNIPQVQANPPAPAPSFVSSSSGSGGVFFTTPRPLRPLPSEIKNESLDKDSNNTLNDTQKNITYNPHEYAFNGSNWKLTLPAKPVETPIEETPFIEVEPNQEPQEKYDFLPFALVIIFTLAVLGFSIWKIASTIIKEKKIRETQCKHDYRWINTLEDGAKVKKCNLCGEIEFD